MKQLLLLLITLFSIGAKSQDTAKCVFYLTEARQFHRFSSTLYSVSLLSASVGLYDYYQSTKWVNTDTIKYHQFQNNGRDWLLLGGTCMLAGWLFNELAWRDIGRSGQVLDPRLSFDAGPAQVRLCWRIGKK